MTAVVTHVEHPANYQLPHVRLDLNLDECEIVWVAGKIPRISIIIIWVAVIGTLYDPYLSSFLRRFCKTLSS